MSDTLKELAAARNRETKLRATIQSLGRQLDSAKHKKAELAFAVEKAVSEAIAGLVIPEIPRPELQLMPGDPLAMVVCLGDVQIGRRTRDYSTRIAERRVCTTYADTIEQLVAIERAAHPVTRCCVYLLGDIVDGEMIFPGQAHMIDSSLYRQVCDDGPRIITTFLRRMLGLFDEVHVVAVVGNHGEVGGRSRRDYSPETNADRMVYSISKQLLADQKRLTWNIPFLRNDRAWYAVDYPFGRMYSHGNLVFHGERVKLSPTTSLVTVAKRLWGLKGAIPEPFKYAFWGHYTNAGRYYLNDLTGWCNGGVESSNTYAQEEFQSGGTPQQFTCFVHPKRGVVTERWVVLT